MGDVNWEHWKPKAKPRMDGIRLRVWVHRVSTAAETVAHVGKTLCDVASKPTAAGIVGAAISVAGTYIHTLAKQTDTTPEGWEEVETGLSSDILSDFEVQGYHGLHDFMGQRVILRGTYAAVDGDAEVFLSNLRRYVWERYGQAAVVSDWGSKGVELASNSEDAGAQSSPRTEAVWERLAPCLRRGRSRAIMLDGRPGTGKSTMARALAAKVGGTLLRIPLGKAGRFGEEECEVLLRTLKPDVVIIDDFDRLGSSAIGTLDTLEKARKSFRLFIVTTNDLTRLDPAVTRAGRFDELFTVGSLGASYTSKVLGDDLWALLSEEQRTTANDWPVAFLEELKVRHGMADEVEGFDLSSEFTDLANRVARNSRPAWATMRRVGDDGLEKSTKATHQPLYDEDE